jgi:hypothetical protein
MEGFWVDVSRDIIQVGLQWWREERGRKSSALRLGSVSRRPSAITIEGVSIVELLCLLTAHFVIFYRFFGVETASNFPSMVLFKVFANKLPFVVACFNVSPPVVLGSCDLPHSP